MSKCIIQNILYYYTTKLNMSEKINANNNIIPIIIFKSCTVVIHYYI